MKRLHVALCACLQARKWRLLYAMTTVAVVLSEKVDTTLSKGVLRIAGTVMGGVIGAPTHHSAYLTAAGRLYLRMPARSYDCLDMAVLHSV